MKGDGKVLKVLNDALTLELTAINQYFVQAKMCSNWGYKRLAKKHRDESIDEMKHADKLMDRILFLDGTPEIARYDVIRVGKNVKQQLENDLALELKGQKLYNAAVQVCEKAKDAGSRELMEENLEGTEEAIDWLEAQLHVIGEVGIENYLSEQLKEGAS